MQVKAVPDLSVVRLGGDAPRNARQAELRRAAEGFEELFLNELLKAAHSAHLAEDVLGGSGVDQAQSMFDAEVARASSGRTGFGLADAVERQFSPYLRQER